MSNPPFVYREKTQENKKYINKGNEEDPKSRTLN